MSRTKSSATLKVAIIGSGTVGRATGLALAVNGHDVLFYDTEKVAFTPLPYFAQRTQELVQAWNHADVLMLCLPTPSEPYGGCNTSIYECVIDDLAKLHASKSHGYKLVVQKSTLPPGTARRMAVQLHGQPGLNGGSHMGYCVNPEFLNAGSALRGAVAPEKVIVGVSDVEEEALARKLYGWVHPKRVHVMTYEEAEFAKYANNLFHALLISMWNELQMVADRQSDVSGAPIDMNRIAQLTAQEPGLESVYRVFGKAWGGACLPKDTRAFQAYARQLGFSPPITTALITVNELVRSERGEQTKHWDDLHK